MNSNLYFVDKFCPRCGAKLLPTGMCSVDGCWYVLTDYNSIDISFKSQGIAKALSNLCNYKFKIDDVECASMEAFIQSLRTPDPYLQEEICKSSGPFCYSIRTILPDWRITQTVYWRGKKIDRQSQEYSELIKRAYENLYNSSLIFKCALKQSKGYKLIHSIGTVDTTLTLLTPDEYISNLYYLRDH